MKIAQLKKITMIIKLFIHFRLKEIKEKDKNFPKFYENETFKYLFSSAK
jgi:hypothetical protein